ncbi:serpin family protein [Arthrobacter sp. MSA 4-2]|uniref:serpin family protein n=1 Tax=Arthrobacter sp. MSA 4-2 TaxID=2794349 RepID=UPI0018E7EBDC|nr:serpin family protein [Arthrobacter sp. MSA 4-2]MBJ2121146.1 serpin family protein [Arthrobacter sp. MSA 4-2]
MNTAAGDPRRNFQDHDHDHDHDQGQDRAQDRRPGRDDRPGPVPEALRRSAYRLGAALLAGAPGKNVVTSPVSALCALLMLRAGSGSSTAAELDGVLGLPAEGSGPDLEVLLARLAPYDGDPGAANAQEPPAVPVLHLANGVFVDRRTPTGDAFLATLARHSGAGVYPVDFADPATEAVLNGWVSEATGGRMPEAPVEYNPETTLTLLNTAYFAAAWAEPFDPSGTYPEDFRLPDGTTVAVDRMHTRTPARYAAGPRWVAVDVPYTEGFVLRVVLADGDAGPGPALPACSEEALLEVAEAMEEAGEVFLGLGLPRWESDSAFDLLPLLRRLGLRETLGGAPDLSAIQPDAAVSAAAQAASITVGEKGAVAAAVTQFELMATSVPVDPELVVEIDRPFLYAVLHEATGLPLFLGTVTDPR